MIDSCPQCGYTHCGHLTAPEIAVNRLECPMLDTADATPRDWVRFGEWWSDLLAGPDRVVSVVPKRMEDQYRIGATRRGYAVTDRQEADPAKTREESTCLIVVYERTPMADRIDDADPHLPEAWEMDGEEWKGGAA